MAPSIFWYDLETSGTNPVTDRILQFAGVRTDLDLNVIGEPLNMLVRPTPDCVPAPGAIAVTGIDLETLQAEGASELEFTRDLEACFMTPETCVAGFNSLRFDDEFVRQLFYRNLKDPYAREWQGGNSRWDIIDLVRMAYALRPDGMEWPQVDGLPSFRLELLTAANNLEHFDAHDALSDVNATLAVARKVREVQPRLFDYYFSLRDKKTVLKQLYPLGKTPLVHVSGMYGARRGCLAVVLPLCQHPTNSNGVIVYDLAAAPDQLVQARAEDIERLVFSPAGELGQGETRIPLKTIHVNRSPAVATLKTLTPGRAAEMGIDLDTCLANAQVLANTAGLVEKVQSAFSHLPDAANSDPDFLLYGGGFASNADQQQMRRVHDTAPGDWRQLEAGFQDTRFGELLFRMRARNFPALLGGDEAARWESYLAERWQSLLPAINDEWLAMPEDTRARPELQALERYLLAGNVTGNPVD